MDYAHDRRFRARVALCWPFGASVALVSCSGHPSQTPKSGVAALQAPLLGCQMPFRVRHALPACAFRPSCKRPLALPLTVFGDA